MQKGGPNKEVVNDRAKLIMHRLAARIMSRNRDIIESAKKVIEAQKAEGLPYEYLDEWSYLLEGPVEEVRDAIVHRGETMTRLRLSSPLLLTSELDLTDFDLRIRIWRKAKLGLEGNSWQNPEKKKDQT